jgi:hypothetical protein
MPARLTFRVQHKSGSTDIFRAVTFFARFLPRKLCNPKSFLRYSIVSNQ